MVKVKRETRSSAIKTEDVNDHMRIDCNLPIRTRTPVSDDEVQLTLHTLPTQGRFLASCQPPSQPTDGKQRAPCDIVLVIDVSGSMNTSAPLPDTGKADVEDTGLSILDLVKHASMTILEKLDDNDRLGIVTFSDDAKVVQELVSMTKPRKKESQKRIEKVYDNGITNLWSGIRAGLKLFDDAGTVGNVQGLYVLTDGQPNHMCPKQGYVNKLKPMLATMAETRAKEGATMPTIHTFGFGYDIRSDLMQSIAEVGNGNYAFIPDAGMIGTVFVHAVANLFTTFAVEAVLDIETSSRANFSCPIVFNVDKISPNVTRYHLGNIQYGQSRDLVFALNGAHTSKASIGAVLRFRDPSGEQYAIPSVLESLNEDSDLSPVFAQYHSYRADMCSLLAAFSPTVKPSNEHKGLDDVDSATGKFAAVRKDVGSFMQRIHSSPYADDPSINSLLQDLNAAEGESNGQITKALLVGSDRPYYQKWGRHYLPSVLHAHARQVCNSFKDPGPLMYGRDSPMFVMCRDQLDQAFDNLPAPKPSRPTHHAGGGRKTNSIFNMAWYNSSSNPCFDGSCMVKLASDMFVQVQELRVGMQVWTPRGSRKVLAVLKTDAEGDKGMLCNIGDLWITPWHPLLHEGRWAFPAEVATTSKACTGAVYSVMLEQSNDVDAHAIEVGGVICVTLGHGLTVERDGQPDVRAHGFLGDRQDMLNALLKLKKDDKGHQLCAGVLRDSNGLVWGFQKPSPELGQESDIARL